MNCLIVDDNKLARTAMRQLASHVSLLQVVGECGSAMEAYNLLQQEKVDLLLLDIEMPGMSGLELTRNLGKSKPLIIFTTVKKDYAVEAFELNVVDYLIKPVQPARFIQAIEKAKELCESSQGTVQISDAEFIFIRDNGVLKRIRTEDILYLEAMGDYVKLHTPARFHAIHSTLKSLEEKLPSSKFMRVHRSYIVSLDKIESIEDGTIIIQKHAIPVADAYRNSLNSKLNLL
ncbi:two component transcriptional regulator, LytTR family [Chitinophaga terrae (ex Kim and Jung 2007)]|uniref:Two component transcriptional regulator, LytTR family n=1 Tax=Chitinophaga terrae (ex Kim and Jung 2007) TaxID=408074 RepID=A0A1H4B6Z3_9BACT|nr:LytTR family DNA-binding domain-containing protein [Chitinophaga terrae (ex Kim and Jung 2007)]MDQ0106356.1 DNA-binding LytR/AlgR family response regulator [Chitinophaga terrae (ex Kim and Jung 2007)]GEP91179.1 DNA-binding response regulator [Chitinophaga terrae (ex Kim and Jung 2007)]SEA43602.1 two component transcriptional regulator, LytTR family [Chitinophaga terrae (ex Kim and Jung 2007)]